MLKKLKIAFVLVLIYMVFMLALLPARFVTSHLEQKNLMPPQVALGTVTGTVWQGNLSSLTYQGVVLDNVKWELSPLSIFTGTISVGFKAGKPRSAIRASGQLAFNNEGLAAHNLSIKTSLAPLLQSYPLPYGLTSTGRVNLNIATYQQDQPWCKTLDGVIKADDLLIKSAFGQLAVANVSAKLSCPNGVLTATMQPSSNSLGIDGDIQLNKARQYNLNARVLPPADASQDYLNVLKFSGSPNSQGQYVFKYSGKL